MDESTSEAVVVEREGPILAITLNRPEVMNAVDLALALGVSAAMDLLDSDDSLRVGVVSGAGLNFCSGLDLKAFQEGQRPRTNRGFAGLVERPSSKPLIAAVEGYALGGGFEVALACDLLVASSDAVFGLPEVRRGLIAGGGALFRLPRRIPTHVAAEWILTGRHVSAEEADHAGLVNQLVAPGQAWAAADVLAQQIAANGPLAIQASKRVLHEGHDWAGDVAFDRQREIYEEIRSSEDAKEGARAFLERRPARWTMR